MDHVFKVREYDPKRHHVKESWVLTRKIDGVQVVYKDGKPLSRAGKQLNNLPDMPDGIYECFIKDWSVTVSSVRTESGTPIDKAHLYMLHPTLDPRLELVARASTDAELQAIFRAVVQKGSEGLVIQTPEGMLLKVKDKKTYDVPVIGYQPGRGKHEGRMGALITPMGKVGTGFSDAQRIDWKKRYDAAAGNLTTSPLIIEVECMELTPDGKFRHPRFVRLREDKALD